MSDIHSDTVLSTAPSLPCPAAGLLSAGDTDHGLPGVEEQRKEWCAISQLQVAAAGKKSSHSSLFGVMVIINLHNYCFIVKATVTYSICCPSMSLKRTLCEVMDETVVEGSLSAEEWWRGLLIPCLP